MTEEVMDLLVKAKLDEDKYIERRKKELEENLKKLETRADKNADLIILNVWKDLISNWHDCQRDSKMYGNIVREEVKFYLPEEVIDFDKIYKFYSTYDYESVKEYNQRKQENIILFACEDEYKYEDPKEYIPVNFNKVVNSLKESFKLFSYNSEKYAIIINCNIDDFSNLVENIYKLKMK